LPFVAKYRIAETFGCEENTSQITKSQKSCKMRLLVRNRSRKRSKWQISTNYFESLNLPCSNCGWNWHGELRKLGEQSVDATTFSNLKFQVPCQLFCAIIVTLVTGVL
jgi:hypothetical protein